MQNKIDLNKIALNTRKTWSFNPVTKVVKSKKVYSRKDKSWKKNND